MSYTLPYSFTPGTKARAQEVNANFNALTDYFDSLDSAKADINLSNISTQGLNVIKNNSSIRNIGEIIISPIPLSDSGLHLLDGSIVSDDGIYKDFIKYMTKLYNNDQTSNYFTSESSWQNSVTTYGICGKFVYNAASGSTATSVRLPKITGIIESTTDLASLGDLVEAGLPNITGTTLGYPHWNNGAQFATSTTSGAFSQIFKTNSSSTSVSTNSASPSYGSHIDYNAFDASRSSSVYGKSSTVQPQTIKMLYYIVIASTPKTDIQVDIDEIATDLNGKADVDLTNTAATLSSDFLSKLMPDYENAIIISSVPYTAPCAGVCDICVSGSDLTISVNNVIVARDGIYTQGSSSRIFLDKNDVITTANGLLDTVYPSKFFPLKGAN